MKKLSRIPIFVAVVAMALLAWSCSDDNSVNNGSNPMDVNGGGTNDNPVFDYVEADSAFQYLNMVRANPSVFSSECNIDLSGVEHRPALVYNDILERVAREKALDMATRNYFGHQNPEQNGIDHLIVKYGYPLDSEDYLISEKSSNYESLQAKAASKSLLPQLTGIEAVRGLIWDGGGPRGGHREHLLGIGMRSTLDECGIGFVRCTRNNGEIVKNYTCVIIAKRKR